MRLRGWHQAVALAVATGLAATALDLDAPALHDLDEARRAWQRASALASGFGHPDLSAAALTRMAQLAGDTLAIAILGTGLGAGFGLVLGTFGSVRVAEAGGRTSALTRGRVQVVRVLLDALRAIPDFAWALAILVVLGPGPLTGALAIAMTVTGVLGRTYGQLLDAVPPGPVRAAERAGASGLAASAYGRWPAIGPAAWSYTLARLECSIRNASVIGIVGGGGLGAELFEELGYGQDDRVATVLLTLLALTAAADLASGWLRRRRARDSATSAPIVGPALLALGVALVWLAPATWDLVLHLRGTDLSVATDAIRRAVRPELTPALVWQCGQAAVMPLALAWLATVGSAFVALLLVPWTCGAAIRRGHGPASKSARRGLQHARAVALRGLALVFRAVPDVAWLLLIAAALRMGALAAGCALALHSTGVLVRLYTETADDWASPHLRRGPGFGTSWLVYRVGPGVRGTLLTHTTLQAEANLRAAFALGIVGAGGLGDAFHTAISYWQLERASTLALAMVVLFVVLDRLARRASGGENPSTAARGSSSAVP